LQGGGYAVQVDGGTGHTRLVKVTLGLFDDSKGLVEVTSGGLQPGDRIVVASS
jgi:multidrug efflux pump subunit AcrA (membrane-fusion protein)